MLAEAPILLLLCFDFFFSLPKLTAANGNLSRQGDKVSLGMLTKIWTVP